MTEGEIKELAENLDCGYKCFLHRQTKEMTFIPDADRLPSDDFDAWRIEEEKIQRHPNDYIAITGLNSRDSFQLMVDFSKTINDERVKARLIQVLHGPNPFRNFKYEIDNSGPNRERWFQFKDDRIRNWVEKQLRENKFV
jgi:hypothetical protein